MDFVTVVDQAIALLRQRGRLTYRTLQFQFQRDDAHLDALKDELIEGQRLAVDEGGRVLVWAGAPPPVAPAPRPLADAERQLQRVLVAVVALLQREQRVTYRTLQYVFDVDEACLHAVRDELGFRHLAREEGGQGLVWIGPDAPPAVSPPPGAPAPALSRSAAPPRLSLPPPEDPRALPGAPPTLDSASSLAVDDGVASFPDNMPVLTPAGPRQAPDAESRQITVLFCDLV